MITENRIENLKLTFMELYKILRGELRGGSLNGINIVNCEIVKDGTPRTPWRNIFTFNEKGRMISIFDFPARNCHVIDCHFEGMGAEMAFCPLCRADLPSNHHVLQI